MYTIISWLLFVLCRKSLIALHGLYCYITIFVPSQYLDLRHHPITECSWKCIRSYTPKLSAYLWRGQTEEHLKDTKPILKNKGTAAMRASLKGKSFSIHLFL